MNEKRLFLVQKKPKVNFSVVDIYDVFNKLEEYARKHYSNKDSFGGFEVVSNTGLDEFGYFILVAGGISDHEHFCELAKKTVSEGVFEPGVYLLPGFPKNQVLIPEHKINFRPFFKYIPPEDRSSIMHGFTSFLKKDK